VVDLMNLEDQVDLDFTRARRRAWLGRLKTLLLHQRTRPPELYRLLPGGEGPQSGASARMHRGITRRLRFRARLRSDA
jgi:hypothetical protein